MNPVPTTLVSPTLAMNETCARLREQGRRIYQLGFGQSPFPIPDSVVEALRANAFRKDYLPVQGLPALRDAVGAYHRRFNHVNATSDDILIGPGSKELIFLLQVTHEADLLLPSPSWVSYAPQAQILGRRVQWLPTRKADGWRLTAETLQQACGEGPRRRLLILNDPNNPTGLTFRAAELERLAEVARAHEVVVLSDEIYGELDHSATHHSIANFYPEGTIISAGLSKWCGAGGWRLGTFCFPSSLRWLLDAMTSVASETYTSVSAPIQYAAVTAYRQSAEIETYVYNARRILRALGRSVSRRLQSAGVDVHPAEGGFYLFPDFGPRVRGVASSAEFCDRLLAETGVALLPGSDFGRPPDEVTCRMAYVDFDGGLALAAAQRIPAQEELSQEFTQDHCADVLEAVDILCRWL
jgi:aspartate aminotransferase